MANRKTLTRSVTIGLSFLAAGILLGVELGTTITTGTDAYKALKKLEDAFWVVTQRYVTDVDADKLSEAAIQGMLENLDPHTVYIDAERMKRVSEDFNAAFEGIGIAYELIPGKDGRDTIAVLSPLPGGPSEEAGLLSGDRIVAIDDSSAIGFKHEDVQKNLKGPRGTHVVIDVKRPGYGRMLRFDITRDKIPIHTVDAAYMLDGNTGYIKLNRFARTTHSEFRESLKTLMDAGSDRLILDLRGNAGGYMEMAVRISDEFLPGNQVIVSQKGRLRDTNETFRSRDGGLFESKPVIVLVDENSASASEIVAGALQDHDRALIVGRRTFGKGLVQKQFPLNDGSALRVTVSRYYTPSGRLIQTPYDGESREEYYESKMAIRSNDVGFEAKDLIDLSADSLKFFSDAGRVVLGGGGILPDFIVYPDSLSGVMQAFLGQALFNSFVRDYLDAHGESLREAWPQRQAFISNFEVGADIVAEFKSYAKEHGIEIGSQADADADLEDMMFSEQDFLENELLLTTLIKGRMATRLYDRGAWYEVYRNRDRVLNKAMDLWSAAENLAYHERP